MKFGPAEINWENIIQLAKHNKSPTETGAGHESIAGNERADQVARTGPEPACGISTGVAKKAVRDGTNINHKKHWESVTGLKQAKGLMLGPSTEERKI
jgi:hypothetical protein